MNLEMELTGGSDEPSVETPVEGEAPVEEAPSPEEAPVESDPVEGEPAEGEPTPEETTLYETPDGRQVTAEVLQKEWKENFLPEFTRKSQALADIEREKNLNNTQKDEPAWKSPDYVPQNYAEVIELAKAEAIAEMRSSVEAEQAKTVAIQEAVQTELTDLKTKNPDLDENVLFQHANKYGFNNLTQAYQNMTDMKKSAVDTEARTLKNIKNREVDPISTGPSGELPEASGYDPSEMSQFEGAADYLAHIKKGK